MRFLIKTFGCRVNQAESREITKRLVKWGFKIDKKTPEVVVLNTCVVTKKAEKEVRQEIRRLRRENPEALMVVTGCAVELWKKKGRKDQVLWVGNKGKKKIPEMILKGKKRVEKKALEGEIDKYARHGKALVKIQDGCNQFCTYCIVPHLRGRIRSVNLGEVIKKIKKLEDKGIREVILTGINLSSYKDGLGKLMGRILKETKIEKISFGSIGLGAFDEEFFKFYKDKVMEKRLTKHFHIPLQSGCNETLKRMGRDYTVEDFKKQISHLRQGFGGQAKIKEKIPGATFSTDVMVGFPGETREEFEESLRNIKDLGFSKIHVFRYSSRPGTVAAKKEGRQGWEKVDEKEKKKRSRAIRGLLHLTGKARRENL